jgi:hypothetical protein
MIPLRVSARRTLASKAKQFSLHFFDVARPIFFQKGKEKFLFWIYFSIFILLVASVPPSPTLAIV